MSFVKIFGISMGVIFIAYGIAVMVIGINGVGPCGATCSLNESLLRLLGQRNYGLAYGFSWAISGLLLCLFILFRTNKAEDSRRKGKSRNRRK